MKISKKVLAILAAGLTGLWILAGCGEPGEAEELTPQTIIGLSSEESSAEPEPGSTDMQGDQSDSEEEFLQQYKDYTLVFYPDDFAPEEILCDNVFSSYQDGKENPELKGMYEKAGEEWEYLYYVRYDLDGDGGEPDYIVLHCNPGEAAGSGTRICGGDIWFQKIGSDQSVTWLRQKLPDTSYLIGGTWEEPELYMRLMTQSHNQMMQRDIAVYRDYEASELVLYGRDGPLYERVMAYSVEEEAEGVRIRLTGYQTLDGDSLFFYGMPVWVELIKEENGKPFYQVILVDRMSLELTQGETNCMIWDGNDDGYEDILYYAGYSGGSGGVWDFYNLLCWSEEEQQYIKMDLPACTSIDYEGHRLYSCGQNGAFHEYYEIYGLQDGEYRLEKELELIYKISEDDEGIDLARYSEYGEVVEEIDITDLLSREGQAQAFLEEKYPEFNFWR